MIEETDTDIEVRKYADAQAARELGVEPYPSLAGTSINPLPTNDIDQYFADLGAAVDGVKDTAAGVVAGVRQVAQEGIDTTVDFMGERIKDFYRINGFGKALGATDEAEEEYISGMYDSLLQELDRRGINTDLPLKSLQPDTEIGIMSREMTAYLTGFLMSKPSFKKAEGLGDSVLDTIGDWGYRLLSNVRANSVGAHSLNVEEANLSQLAVELGFAQELNDYFAEGSLADQAAEVTADELAMRANPDMRGRGDELTAEARLMRKVDTILEDNVAGATIAAAIMTAAKGFKTARAFPKTTGAVVGGAAMAPEDGETSPLSAVSRAAKPAMSTADNMGGAAKVAPATDLDELGFYSQAQRAAEGLGMDSGTGEQFLAMLKKAGVKEDELKWTGLDQVLAKPRVTKQEIINHLEANRVELRETELVEPDAAADPSNPDGIAQFSDSPDIYEEPDAYEYRTEDWIYDMDRIDPDAADDIEDEYWWSAFVGNLRNETRSSTAAQDIILKIKMDGFSSLSGTDRFNAYEALAQVAREEYLMGEPYILTTDIAGEYEIFGNRDIGYRVQYIGDGSNRMVREDAPTYNEAMVAAEIDALDYGLTSTGTEAQGVVQWRDYTQDGGENYREILLSVDNFDGDPDRVTIGLDDIEQQEILALQNKAVAVDLEPDEQRRLRELSDKSSTADRRKAQLKTFRGGHYEQEDLVVHARVSDRYITGQLPGLDTSGNVPKVLYIEELQSDWAQRGRRDGFFRPGRQGDEPYAERGKADDDFLQAVVDQLDLNTDPDQIDFSYNSESSKRVQLALKWFIENTDEAIPSPGRSMNKTLQTELAKRFIRDYPGTPAAIAGQKLLDLAEEIKGIEGMVKGPFVDSTDKWVTVAMKRILQKAIEDGYDYVAWTPGSVQVDRWGEQGLATAYDKVIPKNSQKLLDRIDKGTKLEVIDVHIANQGGQQTLAIPITNAMRNQAPGGLPLFSGGGAAVVGGGAAVSQGQGENAQMEMQF